MTIAIHFLRHGEVFNPEKILCGRQQSWYLFERGVEMAIAGAPWSKQFDVGVVHASPLQRAQATTKQWIPSCGKPYEHQNSRMLADLFAARDAAGGKIAFAASHQLSIWKSCRAFEGVSDSEPARNVHEGKK